ncbi:hypothetical protein GALMADRAFT_607283 [Galerina marginata CBS 339.88]|uniref:Telomere length regulation protein conserved domain-containing protein n=1 Tax=Galerina marginata (strain CBS 339.88) TaxID=685588 RepID=A0A067SR90_GALM3|nr:hypothetical protein GALMADRAFT_607283 [Galerina marginata CBS 339.88]
MMDSDSRAQIQGIIEQLLGQIPDLPTLLSLLAAPLDTLGLLPPQFRRYNTRPLPSSSHVNIKKHIPQLQRVLLTSVVPTWDTLLAEAHATQLLDQYFCPDAFSNASGAAGKVALCAYGTLMSIQLVMAETGYARYALRMLERLAREYTVDRLFRAVFDVAGTTAVARAEREVDWEDCVKNLCMVPTKVANAFGAAGEPPPSGLENATYFNHLSIRCEELLFDLSGKSKWAADAALPSLTYLLGKLVNLGIFPPSPPTARSQPSFFQAALPIIRERQTSNLNPELKYAQRYSVYWSALFLAVPSSLTLQSILGSLFSSLSGSLQEIEPSMDGAPAKRASLRREAALLDGLVGKITPLGKDSEGRELWEIATSLMMMASRDWPEAYARLFVCWVSGGARGEAVNMEVLDAFLDSILDIWSSPEHIKHSLISRHRYTTALLLLTVSYFPPSSSHVHALVSAPNFIKAISVYISHLDPSVRRCGMLAAEVVAQLCGKQLNFGDWEGDGQGKPWCRALRQLLGARDVDAELQQERASTEMELEEVAAPRAVDILFHPTEAARATFAPKGDGYDSDDSMTGYASPPSSRSASPSPSELAEVEKDPTLNVGVKKVPRPVYLVQLGELLRGGSSKVGPDDPHEADRIEMALNCAEELIRKKRGYGTELDENAVNLVHALLALQDNFDLEGFGERRQGALNALVACAPRKAPPALIQEFFKNQYSADQRFVALNALAIGARELASLPVPPSRVPAEHTIFPSKILPGSLHQKYVMSGKADMALLPIMVEELSKQVLQHQQVVRDTASEITRERRLRVQLPQHIMDVPTQPVKPYSQMQKIVQPRLTQFLDVAAECFIVPLINRFWVFLQDEQTREEHTAHHDDRAQYRGAGTGLILNPLVLSQFLRTLAILVNASQNAPEWLAIIAPDSLELAVTLGTQPVSYMEGNDDEDTKLGALGGSGGNQGKEASSLTSALELALVVLDAALETDGGRVLGLEHTTLVLGLGEWAGKVFSSLEKGQRVQGGGGVHELKLSRAAAGVLLKVDELTSKWRRSMLDITR